MVALLAFGSFEVTGAMVAGGIVAILVLLGLLKRKQARLIILACTAGTAVTLLFVSMGL
jgi:hypothetical protein